MKRITLRAISLLFFWLISITACHRQAVLEPYQVPTINEDIDIKEAKSWFEQQSRAKGVSGARKKFLKNPSWDDAIQMKFAGANAVVVPLEDDDNAAIPRNRYKETHKDKLNQKDDKLSLSMLSNLLVYKKDDQTITEIVTLLPDDDFYNQPSKRGKSFNGLILVTDLDENPLKGYQYNNGKLSNTVSRTKPNSPGGRTQLYQIIGWTDYYYMVNGGGGYGVPQYSYSDPIYGWVDDNFAINGGDYLSVAGGGGGSNNGGSQGFYFPGNYDPEVSPYEQVKCFFPASNTTRDFKITIFVDQPGSNSSGSSTIAGDVGHTFISFNSVDRNTGDVIERVFGFYPSSSLEAPIGTLSRINSNQGHTYDVSITFSVSPSQMSQAAQAALNSSSNQYVLSGYNCTNYAESICDAAGVTLPESSKKIWQGNTWVFIHSPGKLGKELRDLKNSDPSLPINVPPSPLNAPNNSGNCN